MSGTSPPPSFVEVREPLIPQSVFPSSPYACLVVISDPILGEALRESLASSLVASGCVWVSFFGAGAEAHEESVDWANVDATVALPPEQFVVVTTSHTTEPLSDVASMVALLREPEHSARLVLGIGPSARAFDEIRAAFAGAT